MLLKQADSKEQVLHDLQRLMAAAPATHGTTSVVILARFSGFISMQFPRDNC